MQPTDVAVSVLATRRLTRLVVEDEITRPLREKVSRIHPKLAYLVGCQMCVSIWAAGAVVLMPRKARLGLAMSEGAILVGIATHTYLGE